MLPSRRKRSCAARAEQRQVQQLDGDWPSKRPSLRRPSHTAPMPPAPADVQRVGADGLTAARERQLGEVRPALEEALRDTWSCSARKS